MHMKGEPMVGKEKWAKEKELCLSDAYIVKDNEIIYKIIPEETDRKNIMRF